MTGAGKRVCISNSGITFLIMFFIALISVQTEAATSFTDDFSGGINTDHWTVTAGAYTIDDTQGDIRISKPAGGGAWAQVFFGHDLYGDFDVSVDYSDAVLAGCQNQIQLNLIFGGQYVADRRENWCASRYSVWLDPGGTVGETGTSDTSGTLRVTRVGSVVTFYANGSQIYQGTFNDSPVTDLWLSLQNNGTADAISVTFDNFSITADSIDGVCTAPPSGMISWWGGDNNALDMIGTNNGTLMNGAIYDTGRVGEAFSFDGVDDYVEVPLSASFDFGTKDFAIDAWIYPQTYTDQAIVSRWDFGTAWDLRLGWGSGVPDKLYFFFGDAPGSGILISDAVTLNQWHHVAVTRRNSVLFGYLDGIEFNAGIQGGNASNANARLAIGKHLGYGNPPFRGLIDEVEIFNRALTVDEIALIYHAGSAGKCRTCATPPSGMVSWWKGEDNAGDSVDGNNGTLIGNTTYETGKVGQAISFDGAGDYVEIPDSASLDLTRISMSFWFKLNELNRVHELANKIGPEGSDTISYGSEIGPDNKAYFRISTGGTLGSLVDAASTTVLTSGIWYHFAGTYDGSSVKIFINGTEEDSKSQSGDIFNSPENLKLGTYGYYPWYLNGLIDEVAVFDRALSADEIASIYNAGSAGKCVSDTTPAQFTFTDQTDVDLNTVVESNTITVSGINSETFIGITDCTGTNCEYRINSGSWTSTDGTVNNGDTVQVRQTSSWSYSATTDLTLNIGPVFDVFSVTTKAVPPGPLPDLTGSWYEPITEKCKVKKEGLVCKIKGKLIITNIGEADAHNVHLRIYLSDDDSYDEGDILLEENNKGDVVVGKTYRKSLKLTLPVGMSLADGYIIAYIDADNTTTESNESNNFVVYGEDE